MITNKVISIIYCSKRNFVIILEIIVMAGYVWIEYMF